jgi:hypothetical protein
LGVGPFNIALHPLCGHSTLSGLPWFLLFKGQFFELMLRWSELPHLHAFRPYWSVLVRLLVVTGEDVNVRAKEVGEEDSANRSAAAVELLAKAGVGGKEVDRLVEVYRVWGKEFRDRGAPDARR